MKKTTLNVAIAIALSTSAFTATSVEAAVLGIDGSATKMETSYVNNKGATIVNQYTQGSWFSMDADGSGSVEQGEVTQISGLNGLTVDGVTTQTATGSHNGLPGCTFNAGSCSVGAVADDPLTTAIDESAPGFDFTEAPDIDNPWAFFGQTGMHNTTSAVTTLSNDGAGNVTLDFSGWNVTWSGIPSIPMGGDADNFDPALNTGIASMSCFTSGSYDVNWPFELQTGAATDCASGAFYTLDHVATVPLGDASGFGGVPYVVHLEGTIAGELPAVIPVPAAVWLFGSGLLGLVGVARRRKA